MSIGGNPAVAGNIALDNSTVEQVSWKSSANASPEEVHTIKLDGVDIWKKPDYSLSASGSYEITTDEVTINVTLGSEIDSWKYSIAGGAYSAVLTTNTTSFSFSTGGVTEFRVKGFRGGVEKAETSFSLTIQNDFGLSAVAVWDEETEQTTLTVNMGSDLTKWSYERIDNYQSYLTGNGGLLAYYDNGNNEWDYNQDGTPEPIRSKTAEEFAQSHWTLLGRAEGRTSPTTLGEDFVLSGNTATWSDTNTAAGQKHITVRGYADTVEKVIIDISYGITRPSITLTASAGTINEEGAELNLRLDYIGMRATDVWSYQIDNQPEVEVGVLSADTYQQTVTGLSGGAYNVTARVKRSLDTPPDLRDYFGGDTAGASGIIWRYFHNYQLTGFSQLFTWSLVPPEPYLSLNITNNYPLWDFQDGLGLVILKTPGMNAEEKLQRENAFAQSHWLQFGRPDGTPSAALVSYLNGYPDASFITEQVALPMQTVLTSSDAVLLSDGYEVTNASVSYDTETGEVTVNASVAESAYRWSWEFAYNENYLNNPKWMTSQFSGLPENLHAIGYGDPRSFGIPITVSQKYVVGSDSEYSEKIDGWNVNNEELPSGTQRSILEKAVQYIYSANATQPDAPGSGGTLQAEEERAQMTDEELFQTYTARYAINQQADSSGKRYFKSQLLGGIADVVHGNPGPFQFTIKSYDSDGVEKSSVTLDPLIITDPLIQVIRIT